MHTIEKKTYIVLGNLKTLCEYNVANKEKIKSDDCIFTKDWDVLRDCILIDPELKVIDMRVEGEIE